MIASRLYFIYIYMLPNSIIGICRSVPATMYFTDCLRGALPVLMMFSQVVCTIHNMHPTKVTKQWLQLPYALYICKHRATGQLASYGVVVCIWGYVHVCTSWRVWAPVETGGTIYAFSHDQLLDCNHLARPRYIALAVMGDV